jgi:hypothetical protein
VPRIDKVIWRPPPSGGPEYAVARYLSLMAAHLAVLEEEEKRDHQESEYQREMKQAAASKL